jgi:PAS domain S-box-containing protein
MQRQARQADIFGVNTIRNGSPPPGSDAWAGPYTTYARRLGAEPGGEMEPILEALPYGAYVIDILGRILCVNARHADLTGIRRGMTLEEVIEVCDIHDLAGHPMVEEHMPEAGVLLEGRDQTQGMLRMRSALEGREVVIDAECRPVRGLDGRVIGVIVIAREVTEDVALAIEVGRAARMEPEPDPSVFALV